MKITHQMEKNIKSLPFVGVFQHPLTMEDFEGFGKVTHVEYAHNFGDGTVFVDVWIRFDGEKRPVFRSILFSEDTLLLER